MSLARVSASVADVLPERPVEQERVLGYQRDVFSQAVERYRIDNDTIYGDTALCRFMKPKQKLHDG